MRPRPGACCRVYTHLGRLLFPLFDTNVVWSLPILVLLFGPCQSLSQRDARGGQKHQKWKCFVVCARGVVSSRNSKTHKICTRDPMSSALTSLLLGHVSG